MANEFKKNNTSIEHVSSVAGSHGRLIVTTPLHSQRIEYWVSDGHDAVKNLRELRIRYISLLEDLDFVSKQLEDVVYGKK